MESKRQEFPGNVVLFGSGETTPSGRKFFDALFDALGERPRVSILETPAGFELNSDRVAGRVAEFITHRLQNYQPLVEIIPARKKGTLYSPDNEQILQPILDANVIFMGPGSPTYAVRQLQDSLAWEYIRAKHRLGTALAFSSAVSIAVSRYALPVYEIFKVGEDIHWKPGLDLFADFGLNLVIVPHWNNTEGGAELDTSRCYIGLSRFEALKAMLPEETQVIGIDEQTALWMDFETQKLRVLGKGEVTICRGQKTIKLPAGADEALSLLGEYTLPDNGYGITEQVWQKVLLHCEPSDTKANKPSKEVLQLVERREDARRQKQWDLADRLREEIAKLGWGIKDTPEGPELEKLE